MRVLGLDPGSRFTGFGVIERDGQRLEALACGRLTAPARVGVPERLAHLAGELGALLDEWRPDVAAVETPFHGINTRSLVVLAEVRGALTVVLTGRGLALESYSPAQVKAAVTGSGRADKQQVADLVRRELGLGDRDLSPDASDALAVALCYAHRNRLDRLPARAGAG